MSIPKTIKSLYTAVLALFVLAPVGLAGPNDYFAPGAVGSFPDDTPNGSLLPGASKTASTAQASPPIGGIGSIGGNDNAQSAPAPSATSGSVPSSGMDNTADEKRMQRKYKANLAHMRDLVDKGSAMMKQAKNPNDKMYKKGKILKEMGEKHLADMQANNPFQLDNLEDKKKDKDSK
jgi:hypothetical protein